MTRSERMAEIRREKGKALVRAVHLTELQAAGAARAVALSESEQQLDRIARIMPNALNAGISLAEIARNTGVSRQTLYELKPRYDPSGEIDLAVLQMIATRQPITARELAQQLNRSARTVKPLVERFIEGGFVDLAAAPGDGDDLYLSDTGSSLLAEWWNRRVAEEESR
ncbi:MAG TPA: HTH domain-containing protein [Solirubrobacteraceae bacterium]|nr:HTH domain-containing protein [Solirubrobacteraceae bacterium]